MVYFLTDYYNSFKHKELETSHLIFIIRLKGTDYLLLLHTNSGLFDAEAYIEPTRTSRIELLCHGRVNFSKKKCFFSSVLVYYVRLASVQTERYSK